MFDFFNRNEPTPKNINRIVKKLTESSGEDGPRVEAAERLAEWGTPEALYALLKRFTISAKVMSQDVEEKRYVVKMLVDKKGEAIGPILLFIKKNPQVEWPVQALAQILPQNELVPKLVETLEYVGEGEFTSPEHRTSLIKAMHGLVTPEIATTIQKFLKDEDDDVRIAAIHAIAETGEESREALLQAFVDSDDRPRIRIAVAEEFADHEWPVKGFRPTVEGGLPEGFHLNAKGMIRAKMKKRWAIFLMALWLSGTLWMGVVATQNFYMIDRLIDAKANPAFTVVLEKSGQEEVRQVMRYLSSELNRLLFQVWGILQTGIGIACLWCVVRLPRSTKPKWMIVSMLGISLLFAALITPEIVSLGRALDFVPRDPAPPDLRTFGLLHAIYTVLDAIKLILGILVTISLMRVRED